MKVIQVVNDFAIEINLIKFRLDNAVNKRIALHGKLFNLGTCRRDLVELFIEKSRRGFLHLLFSK